MSPEILSQISLPAAIGLSGLAMAGGAAVARLSGPVACALPARGAALLRRLNAVKVCRDVAKARIAAGALVLGALMVAGGLAAFAAAPASVPDSLPSQVAGVVGSGERLSLRLTGSDGARTVAVGETIADGWILSGLTPTKATLSKDGQIREVGLNPEGSLGSRPTPTAQSRVDLLPSQAMATLNELVKSIVLPDRSKDSADKVAAFQTNFNKAVLASPGATPIGGLNADETQAFFAMSQKIEDLKVAIRNGEGPAVPFFTEDLLHPGHDLIVAALGSDTAIYEAYLETIDDNNSIGALRAQLADNPITGASTYYLPAGARPRDVMAAAGVDPRGTWVASGPDASGGQTYTRLSDLNGSQQTRNMSQAQAALRDARAVAAGADPGQLGMTAAGAANLMATLPASVRAAAGR